jgi:4-alpha-glucanotransferase
MNAGQIRQLKELARRHGVQTSYQDAWGQQQTAIPEALTAALAALGVPAATPAEIRKSLADTESQRRQRCLEPVVVILDHRPATISLRLPGRFDGKSVSVEIQMEDGQHRSLPALPNSNGIVQGNRVSKDKNFRSTHRLNLEDLPFGYHTLKVDAANDVSPALVISAPEKSYSEPHVRDWGAFVPMYAAHSEQSWGAGNFSDWRRLSDWIASAGGRISATTPLLAAFLDYPVCDASPYSPASRLFWNEFYLDIPKIPEFAECEAARHLVNSTSFQNNLSRFRQAPLINYREQWAARRSVLEVLAKFFFEKTTSRHSEFARFLHRRPELKDYAAFRATCEKLKTPWQHWPNHARHGELRPADRDEASERFYLYIQWVAQEQMDRLVAHGHERGVKLYLDLPLGVHPGGYDAWRWRNHFALEASVGAPPDAFFNKGQNWMFAPLHPQRIREDGYRYVLDVLRFQMRHTGLLRIDHVMGLHRLYWIPNGFPADQGVYIRYPAEELHAIFNLESHRHRTMLVGENLGTVPPEVNESMDRHRLRKMFVIQYEQRLDPASAISPLPARSVAGLNTHDMPTFTAHWSGLDIDDRADLGLVPKQTLQQEHAARKKLNAALVKFLFRRGLLKKKDPTAAEVITGCWQWLAKGPADIVLINLEDLLGETEPQNVPGTSRERPNWRRKARVELEALFRKEDVRKLLASIDGCRKQKVIE